MPLDYQSISSVTSLFFIVSTLATTVQLQFNYSSTTMDFSKIISFTLVLVCLVSLASCNPTPAAATESTTPAAATGSTTPAGTGTTTAGTGTTTAGTGTTTAGTGTTTAGSTTTEEY
uniref:Uncharacterized protein n=1 Tax=Cacopsylla melanoneura TaxID=428564 RepID=A0A8D8SD62_9HEMI